MRQWRPRGPKNSACARLCDWHQRNQHEAMPRVYLRLPQASLQSYVSSFFGFMDIKVGAQILTLFSLFNKIAGVYGILAIFERGSLAQLSLYVYSIATIPVFIWGLKAISEEQPSRVLRYAHIFILDHMISTAWTMIFALWWYTSASHDGRPASNSMHQAGLMSLIESLEAQYRTPEEMAMYRHKDLDPNTPEGARQVAQRRESAQQIWKSERGFAAGVLVFGWVIKVRADRARGVRLTSRSTLRLCCTRMRSTCVMAHTGGYPCPSRAVRRPAMRTSTSQRTTTRYLTRPSCRTTMPWAPSRRVGQPHPRPARPCLSKVYSPSFIRMRHSYLRLHHTHSRFPPVACGTRNGSCSRQSRETPLRHAFCRVPRRSRPALSACLVTQRWHPRQRRSGLAGDWLGQALAVLAHHADTLL